MAGPAAVRHEGDHRFSRKILSFQKSQHGRSHRIPPGRSSHRDHIIIRHIHTKGLNRRTIALIDFPLSLIHHLIIASGIGLHGLNPGDIGARPAGKLFRDPLRISVRPGIINNQHSAHFYLSPFLSVFLIVYRQPGRKKTPFVFRA